MLKDKNQKYSAGLLLSILLSLLLTLHSFNLCNAQDEFVYDSKGKRNPFIPLVTPDGRFLKLDKEEEKKGDLIVEGIIYDKNGRSFAIVNTSVVGIGDFVGEYRVLKIEQAKVIFIKEDQVLEVPLSVEKEEK